MERFAAAFAGLALLAPAGAAADPIRVRPAVDGALTAGMVGALAVAQLLQRDLAPRRCRWCGGNDLDSPARRALLWEDTETPATMSDVLAAGIVPAVALGAMTFDAWRQGEIDEAGVDLLLVAEAASAVMFVNGIVKLAAARQRPYAAHAPEGAARDDEDNLSFYSGHSALTFSTVVGSATVAWLRRRRTAPWILAIGLPLAAATAWLRMAADRHWATDVGTGAALGAAFGFAIPLFHGPP